jgi:hypothetical protein
MATRSAWAACARADWADWAASTRADWAASDWAVATLAVATLAVATLAVAVRSAGASRPGRGARLRATARVGLAWTGHFFRSGLPTGRAGVLAGRAVAELHGRIGAPGGGLGATSAGLASNSLCGHGSVIRLASACIWCPAKPVIWPVGHEWCLTVIALSYRLYNMTNEQPNRLSPPVLIRCIAAPPDSHDIPA